MGIDAGYFPIFLSKAFVVHCLFGDTPVSNELLIESFLNFVSPMDCSMFKEALKTTTTIYDDEEFIELLDRYNCRSKVHALNVYGIILELAQQELIQKPFLMVCSWARSLQTLKLYQDFADVASVRQFYSKVYPTTRKVLKLLTADPKSEAQRCCYNYLLDYVRSLDKNYLVRFLRFTTGADIIIVERIDVSLVVMPDNAARRPFEHTCGPLLELPYWSSIGVTLYMETFVNCMKNFKIF